jgi:hypothetical protein
MLGPAMHLGIANSGCLQKDRAMPLFHFNSRTGDVMLPDLEGEEIPTSRPPGRSRYLRREKFWQKL